MEGANGAIDRNAAALKSQEKTAQVSAAATLALAKSDKVLRDAELELSGAAEEARRQLAQQGRAAEEAAAKTELSGGAALGAASAFGSLGTPIGAAVAAGVALAPVLVTVGAGLGGLGVAALGAAKDTAGVHRELAPLTSELSRFQAALKPEVMTLFGQGAGVAAHLLHDLQPVAAATGSALSGVLSRLDAEFAGQQWQQFFTFMGTTAAQDVQLLGNFFIDLAKDIPPLVEGLQPAAESLLRVADGAAKLVGYLEVGTAALYGNTKAAGDAAVGQEGLASSASKAAGAFTELLASAKEAKLVGTLAGDMLILATNTSSSTLALQAWNDEWGIFVGNAVSDQQAVLNVTQAFQGYAATVKQSGRTSVAAQQAFLGIFDTLHSGLDSLLKHGAGVAAVNGYYQTAISRLGALHGLSAAQKDDVRGLTRDYLAWANSVSGLSGNTVTAASVLRQDFLTQLAIGHRLAPTARGDVDALATAILKTGQNSSATRTDRAKLIRDLEKSGLSAFQATAEVNGLQAKISALRGKAVHVDLVTSGSGTIIIRGTGINQRVINTTTGQVRATGGHTLAAGGRVPGFGGGDIWPALLEPGEAVVDKVTTRRHASTLRAMGVPGFAAGGVVGKVTGAESSAGTAEAQWGQLAAQAFATASVQASMKAAAAAAAFLPGAAATGSAAAAQAFARAHLADYRWGAAQWPPLLSLWQRESGWNARAVNPSSGAYGIPQSLGHGHPYNLGDYANQVRWGLAYIFDRYGSPGAAWAHEQGFNWYGSGLDAVFSRPTVIGVGERGRERVQVTPLGRGGTHVTYSITVNAAPGTHPAQAGKAVVEAIREYERVNGAGWRG